MKKLVTALSILLFISTEIAFAQTVIFSENFESGLANGAWGTYYKNEDQLIARPVADAPKSLATGGNYVGWLQDVDTSYNGSAVAVIGQVTAKNYSIEGDVYCYVNHPAGSAYTGLVVYADSSKHDFYKLRVDFDNSDRINLSGLKSDPTTYMPLFSKDFKGVDNPGIYPTSDGWHKVKVEVRTVNDTTVNFWCYFDGHLLKGCPINYHKSTAVTSGKYGLYCFQNFSSLPSYFDNIVVTQLVTEVEETPNVPAEFSLQQNYPNPFNPETVIGYKLPVASYVTLKVYDMLGKEVATLVNEFKQAGSYSIQLSTNNYQLSSGTYFYRITANNFSGTKKMILLK